MISLVFQMKERNAIYRLPEIGQKLLIRGNRIVHVQAYGSICVANLKHMGTLEVWMMKS